MLRASFTQAFYKFLCISKYTTLQWLHTTIFEDKLCINLHQFNLEGDSLSIFINLTRLHVLYMYLNFTHNLSQTSTVQLASKFTARIGKNAYLARFFCKARKVAHICCTSEQITRARNYARKLCWTRFVRLDMQSHTR